MRKTATLFHVLRRAGNLAAAWHLPSTDKQREEREMLKLSSRNGKPTTNRMAAKTLKLEKRTA